MRSRRRLVGRKPSLHALDQQGDAHAATDAQRRQAAFCSALFHFVKQRRRNTARRSGRRRLAARSPKSNHLFDRGGCARAADSPWRPQFPDPRPSNSEAIRRSVQSECAPRLLNKSVSFLEALTIVSNDPTQKAQRLSQRSAKVFLCDLCGILCDLCAKIRSRRLFGTLGNIFSSIVTMLAYVRTAPANAATTQ